MALTLSLSSGLLLAFFFLSLHPSASAISSNISYAPHCNTIVPESNLTGFLINDTSLPLIKGSFFGGRQLFPASSNSSTSPVSTFYLDSTSLQKTFSPDIFHVNCKLVLVDKWSEGRARASFELSGFWSASNGKLCLVGNGQKDGSLIDFPAVVKLDYPNVSDISTSLARGSLESSNHFDSISLIAYSPMQYRYSMISQAQESCSHLPKEEESLGLEANMTCSQLKSYLKGEIFTLDYNYSCKERACRSMFTNLGFLPSYMSMSMIECLEDGRFHFVIQFANNSNLLYSTSFDPRSSLVAEGIWDHEKNQLCVLACPVFLEKPSKYSIDDCAMGFSLWIRRVFSLEKSAATIGNMWRSKRSEDDSGNSNMVSFKGFLGVKKETGNGLLKYRYSKMDAVGKYCQIGNETKPGKTGYPELRSHWNFEVSRNDSSYYGHATLLSIGETYYGYDHKEFYGLIKKPSGMLGQDSASLWNVSYRFTSYASLGTKFEANGLNIAAEGTYNIATRDACMVGCRSLTLETNMQKGEGAYSDFKDCEILVKIKFKSTNKTNHDSANGTIISTRNESDPYYFEPLNISSTTFSEMFLSTESRKRTKIEIYLILVSLIFSCICVAMQLFRAKRQKKVLTLLSMTMLIILALGHIIPLLSLTDSFTMVWGGRWLGLNEIAIGFFLTVAYLLQLWLLQAAWFASSTSQSNALLLLMLWVHVLWVFIFVMGLCFQYFTVPDRVMVLSVKSLRLS